MTQISIEDALERIGSSKQRDRKDGLQDLKHILASTRRNQKLREVRDRGYHAIFEALFRFAQSEKSNYIRYTKANRNQAAALLSECASVFRLAVEAGVKELRQKSLRAAVDHIIDILPEGDGHFCEPLSTHYLRALASILQYQPHPAHLLEIQWLRAIEFCQSSLRLYMQNGDESDSFNLVVPSRSSRRNDRTSRGSSPGSLSGIGTPIHKSFGIGDRDQSRPAMRNHHILNDLVTCLYYLLRVPHARVIEVAKSSLDALNEFLDGTVALSQPQGQEKAFASFGILLNISMTENLHLAKLIFERCIHHARRLWHSKSHDTLKDQILACLGLGAPLFEALICGDDETQQLRNELELFLDVLIGEYSRRNERDLLQADDIELCEHWREDPVCPFVLPSLTIRPGVRRTEHSAIILFTISRLYRLLHFKGDDAPPNRPSESNNETRPRKRQRKNGPLTTMFEDTTRSKGSEQIARLQIFFVLGHGPVFSLEILQEILGFLSGLISHESNIVSGWAMIAVSCLGYQPRASESALSERWIQVWRLATQKLANPATSKMSSHLVSTIMEANLVNARTISESIDALLASIELNGPAVFTDFSSMLWTKVIEFKALQSPASASEVANIVIRWIFLRWQPSQLPLTAPDPAYRSFAGSQPILKLFAKLLGSNLNLGQQHDQDELGIVALSRLRMLQARPLMTFLLLQRDTSISSIARLSKPLGYKSHLNLSDAQFQKMLSIIVNALLAEIQACVQAISEGGRTVKNITADGVSSLCSLAIVSIWLTTHPRSRANNKLQRLQRDAISLSQEIAKLALGSPQKDGPLQGISRSIGPLARLPCGDSDEPLDNAMQQAIRIACGPFHIQFWRTIENSQNDFGANPDLLEMDEVNGSQPGIRSKLEDEDRPVDWLSCSTSATSKNALISLRICLAACQNKLDEASTLENVSVSSGFVDFLLEKPAGEILYCRDFLKELLASDLTLDSEQVERLLAYLGNEILHNYEFERSEVAMGLCLDFLTTYVEDWTTSNDDISDLASQFYQWFTNVAIGKSIASPHVHICLSKLLQRIISVRPDYGEKLSLPSARETLLTILENGQVSVKFEAGVEISKIFGCFILKEHDKILDDVVEHLPMEVDWPEGTAVRILILANLAAAWPTLMRRCLFAIVETPFLVQSATEYVSYCIKQLSSKLNLRNCSDLLRLFVSQIIYSWLESRPLESLPYVIFGYSSLKSLLQDVQEEVTAQILMRGREVEAHVLSEILSEKWPTLLETSFGKVAAYAVARDAAISPEADQEAANSVSRLIKLLGKERYRSLLAVKFPEILMSFFKLIDREDSVWKGFEKYSYHANALSTYGEIRSSGMSDSTLASSQQPSFKASCLADEIDYICTRSGVEVKKMWTPALYIFVFRELVNTLHDALGPLHGITVLQRIRILISMAGSVVLWDYPLEMTLHALRPLLVKTYCAEDAMGIFRYLLSEGKPHLQRNPGFLNGVGIAILVSMRRFINSPQDSTTQESQHKETMRKAEDFHTWIGMYLEKCEPATNDDILDRQRSMIASARNVRGSGSAVVGHAESDLLKSLLLDDLSKTNLVDRAYRSLILSMLCADFRLPDRSRDDIINLDSEATTYANAVWKSCTSAPQGSTYRLWVARVVGRAYAARGHVSPELSMEAELDIASRDRTSSSQYVTSESRFTILRGLTAVLLSDDRSDVGLAELTLQAIANQTENERSIQDCIDELPQALLPALAWKPYVLPFKPINEAGSTLSDTFDDLRGKSLDDWAKSVTNTLVQTARDDFFVHELSTVLSQVDGLASRLFSNTVHLVLLRDFDKPQGVRKELSACIARFLKSFDESQASFARLIIKALLYLRTQQIPREVSKAERSHWLDVDFHLAAEVAVRCNMYKTALLFLEIKYSESIGTVNLSEARPKIPNDILSIIFQNLDDKDSFYGLNKAPNLKALMGQLEFENAGFKSLSFRGAAYDSELQQLGEPLPSTQTSLLKVLSGLDLDGLSLSMFANSDSTHPNAEEIMFATARKLERWDLASPSDISSSSNELFRVFQDIHDAASYVDIRASLDRGFANVFNLVDSASRSTVSIHSTLGALATLTEVEDVLSVADMGALDRVWSQIEKREDWMVTERFDRTQDILSCRKTLFSTLSKSPNLQQVVNISSKTARTIETKALLAASSLWRQHDSVQTCLGNATTLDGLVEQCRSLGLLIDVAAQYEVSNVMWDQGEMASSIQILQEILSQSDLNAQAIPIARPVLLARLGHRVSEARFEKPDEIISNYLVPAIRELHGYANGLEAGQVYHEFAAFCDQQLQNSDNAEDIKRIERIRDKKEKDVLDLEKMYKAAPVGRERDQVKSLLSRARTWLDLDTQEYIRLRDGRQTLLQRSLENYLLCLQACNLYENDVLRFSALWLEYSEDKAANATVAKHLKQVPSGKFASLMNQWTSRLLDTDEPFQKLVMGLVLRICIDHPYHGMYHIFVSSKSKIGRDQTAISRHNVMKKIVANLKSNSRVGNTWIAIHNTNISFIHFAGEKYDDRRVKSGQKILLRKSSAGQKLEQDIKSIKIPPPSMKIDLRPDCDYSQIPIIERYQGEFSIASGASMPKILTVFASNGRKYKQLFKGGSDDLRQDAIMEQVFEQVNKLLKTQRHSRLRNLSIRTYRVLPLTGTAGVIEFVPNTIPLHDYLMPAHQKYFPNDYKPSQCRKEIQDAQSKPKEVRIEAYRKICGHFHPVLRHFFMERFENPDQWYSRRLAYTRSTATISILGHILGIGDRHGHNILLDEMTGEVIHIDLGIAFEQGRVLPVPELVPFRLTRDVVDGMGMTKTEGVFRRCCEFTLDALRQEAYSIMTILDVLRYDPLYSWSISPLRLKRLQDQQAELGEAVEQGDPRPEKKDEQEEADRALAVISKKLSKTLSVAATVNELIQQATDEQNLALLYGGWAAYA